MFKTLVATLLLVFSTVVAGQQIKMAALVPEGTTWGESLKKLSKEVEAATGGEVTFKIYYGGVAGDEPDVLRKIRIGQLSGGIFTGKTLGDIHGDVRAMEIPFTFYSNSEKASATLKKMGPEFDKGLKAKGFVNLGFYEVGQVYVVSTKKITNLDELQGVKIWSWEGDELVGAMLETLKLVSTPLALPDVLSSLSTGIVNAAYAPPLAIIALQWHTKVKFLIDFPVAYSIGALLVSEKVWGKIKPEHQQKVMSISKKFVDEANMKSIADNTASLAQLKKSGIEFVKFPDADIKKASDARVQVIAKVKDKFISGKTIQILDAEAK